MIAATLCCAVIGAALGTRFTVVAVIVAAAVALVLIGLVGITAKWGVLATLGTLAAGVVALELGYFIGCYVGRRFIRPEPMVRWTPHFRA
jgi:hypothetical protein